MSATEPCMDFELQALQSQGLQISQFLQHFLGHCSFSLKRMEKMLGTCFDDSVPRRGCQLAIPFAVDRKGVTLASDLKDVPSSPCIFIIQMANLRCD